MRHLCIAFVVALTLGGCANHAPPNLTPQGTAAFYGTQVIKNLDRFRDVVIDGNKSTPALFSTATTRKVVDFHTAAIKTVHVSPGGWKAGVQAGLQQVNLSLEPEERQVLMPYIQLLNSVLNMVGQS